MGDDSELCGGLLNVNDKRSARPRVATLGSLCALTVELNFTLTFEKVSLPRAVSTVDLTRSEDDLHAVVATEIRFGLVVAASRHDERIGIRIAQTADVISPVGDHVRLQTV